MPKSEDDARSKLVEAQRKAAQAVTAEEKRAAEEEVREAERQFMRMVHAK
jgi:ribosomal protein S20